MPKLTVDGIEVEVPAGATILQACEAAGKEIPRFCYHEKLPIAANCRMCLVDVEKMPKPAPACATPVMEGMKVYTQTKRALDAQRNVMEFLLINHPLDCPICDQGGECDLQDQAMAYGVDSSRFRENKRAVEDKYLGPLVKTAMNRCIHCTRCVRFGQEVAGVMELGMIQRGEHSEIAAVDGRTVDSELSGNMIDICPVGALTSKPFRYSARTWELSRRKSVSPHDSLGANLIIQVKAGKVMRVVPLENEAVNECWISDRDRFSYEALNSAARLTQPMIKQGGVWQTVDWNTALAYVADGLKRVRAEFGTDGMGALAHPGSTLEELHLLAKLVRGLGSENIDHRMRHADFSNTAPAGHARWLGTSVASLSRLDRAFVIGSFLRKDHPLLAQRLRQAARRGAQVHSLHAVHDDWLMPMAQQMTVAPSAWPQALADVAMAVAAACGIQAPVAGELRAETQAIAASLLDGERKALLLGHAAAQHPQAGVLLALANWIAEHTGATVGYLGEGGNAVGAQLVGALPGLGGLHAGQMLSQPMKALLLLNTEPVLDAADAAAARSALAGSGLVVAMTPFKDLDLGLADVADVLLPIAPFTETAGTFVNAEGRVQSFHAVVKPLGDARPAWKVLRVLGNLLGLPGFDQETAEVVMAQALGDTATIAARLDNRSITAIDVTPFTTGLQRIADVPIYATDAIVRRATSLQLTADARPPQAGLPTALWQRLRLQAGDKVLLEQGGAALVMDALEDATLAPDTVRVAAGHPATASLGAMFGAIAVEKV